MQAETSQVQGSRAVLAQPEAVQPVLPQVSQADHLGFPYQFFRLALEHADARFLFLCHRAVAMPLVQPALLAPASLAAEQAPVLAA